SRDFLQFAPPSRVTAAREGYFLRRSLGRERSVGANFRAPPLLDGSATVKRQCPERELSLSPEGQKLPVPGSIRLHPLHGVVIPTERLVLLAAPMLRHGQEEPFKAITAPRGDGPL